MRGLKLGAALLSYCENFTVCICDCGIVIWESIALQEKDNSWRVLRFAKHFGLKKKDEGQKEEKKILQKGQ